jgi:hypothetical protein
MKKDAQTAKMCERLRKLNAQEPEERIFRSILRRIEDPLRPRSENGRFRMNPFLLLLAVIAMLTISAFLYFSFGEL